MPRTEQGEYKAGYAAGMLHNEQSGPLRVLCYESRKRAERAMITPCPPLIRAYWRGYLDALKYRGLIQE